MHFMFYLFLLFEQINDDEAASYKMQQATCIVGAIKLARKWAAPKRHHALDACRSVQRSNRPPGSCPCTCPSRVRQAVVSLVRWRRPSAADDHWRTMNIHRLDCVCDWLPVASCNIMLMRAERLVQVLQDFLQVLFVYSLVVIAFSRNF